MNSGLVLPSDDSKSLCSLVVLLEKQQVNIRPCVHRSADATNKVGTKTAKNESLWIRQILVSIIV